MSIITGLPGELLCYEDYYRSEKKKQLESLRESIKRTAIIGKLTNAHTELSKFAPKDRNEDLYVVAPGRSLGLLTETSRKVVEEGTVIQFNASCLSGLRTDLFLFEMGNDTNVSTQLHRCLNYLVKDGRLESKNIIFKNFWERGKYTTADSPLLDLIVKPGYIKDIMLPASRTKYGLKKGIATKIPDSFEDVNNVFMQYGSTLFIAAHLGCIGGFKNVTFVGADLVNSGYFYETERNVPLDLREFCKFRQPFARRHKTADVSLMRGDIVLALKLLQDKFSSIGVRFWAPHSKSLLARVFDVDQRLRYL